MLDSALPNSLSYCNNFSLAPSSNIVTAHQEIQSSCADIVLVITKFARLNLNGFTALQIKYTRTCIATLLIYCNVA